mmetsp:Transcript_9674/g.24786  ORF Transcript_9674/g.24786 Transcript_9674/m.24786 type:complete len:202 (+) Transcript_9674:2259-2864(+)
MLFLLLFSSGLLSAKGRFFCGLGTSSSSIATGSTSLRRCSLGRVTAWLASANSAAEAGTGVGGAFGDVIHPLRLFPLALARRILPFLLLHTSICSQNPRCCSESISLGDSCAARASRTSSSRKPKAFMPLRLAILALRSLTHALAHAMAALGPSKKVCGTRLSRAAASVLSTRTTYRTSPLTPSSTRMAQNRPSGSTSSAR